MNNDSRMIITFMNGPADGRRVYVQTEKVSIGKTEANDIIIDFDPTIEDRHLEIINKENKWFVECNSDSFKLLRDDMDITHDKQLLSEDMIKLGSTLLKFNTVQI